MKSSESGQRTKKISANSNSWPKRWISALVKGVVNDLREKRWSRNSRSNFKNIDQSLCPLPQLLRHQSQLYHDHAEMICQKLRKNQNLSSQNTRKVMMIKGKVVLLLTLRRGCDSWQIVNWLIWPRSTSTSASAGPSLTPTYPCLKAANSAELRGSHLSRTMIDTFSSNHYNSIATQARRTHYFNQTVS